MIISPKVNVLMSTYNGEKYLEPQISSILNQKRINIHLSIRDDGSADSTTEILKSLLKNNNHIDVVLSTNIGVVTSYFELLANSGNEYDYYALSDQDDVWCEDKIITAIALLKNSSKGETPVMYCSRVEYTDKHLNHLGYSPIPADFRFDNALVENIAFGCTIVMNKPSRDLLCNSIPTNALMHDWWIYLTINAFGKVIYDEIPKIKYRQHNDNAVGGTNNFILKNAKKICPFIANIHSNKFRTTDQANEFLNVFANRLSAQYTSLLYEFVNSKCNVISRIKLIFTTRYRRQNWLDNILYRLQILLNVY